MGVFDFLSDREAGRSMKARRRRLSRRQRVVLENLEDRLVLSQVTSSAQLAANTTQNVNTLIQNLQNDVNGVAGAPQALTPYIDQQIDGPYGTLLQPLNKIPYDAASSVSVNSQLSFQAAIALNAAQLDANLQLGVFTNTLLASGAATGSSDGTITLRNGGGSYNLHTVQNAINQAFITFNTNYLTAQNALLAGGGTASDGTAINTSSDLSTYTTNQINTLVSQLQSAVSSVPDASAGLLPNLLNEINGPEPNSALEPVLNAIPYDTAASAGINAAFTQDAIVAINTTQLAANEMLGVATNTLLAAGRATGSSDGTIEVADGQSYNLVTVANKVNQDFASFANSFFSDQNSLLYGSGVGSTSGSGTTSSSGSGTTSGSGSGTTSGSGSGTTSGSGSGTTSGSGSGTTSGSGSGTTSGSGSGTTSGSGSGTTSGSGSGTTSGSGSGTTSGSGSGTTSGSGSGTTSGSGSGTTSGSGSGTTSGSGSGTTSGSGSGTTSGSGSGTTSGSGSGTTSGSGSGTTSGSGSGTTSGSGSGTTSGSGSGTTSGSGSGTTSGSGSGTTSGSGSGTTSGSGSGTTSGSGSGTTSGSGSGTTSGSGSGTTSGSGSGTTSGSGSVSAFNSGSGSTSGSDPASGSDPSSGSGSMSGSSSAAIPQAVGAVTQAFDSAVAAINQVLQNFSSSGSVSGSGSGTASGSGSGTASGSGSGTASSSGSGTASGSGSGSSLVTTIDSALNGLASQIGSALANVPNGAQVSTFIQAQVADAEFILDALANDLEATAGTAGQNVSALDVVLANDVLDLAELNAQYDIESLGGGTNGSNGA